MLRTSVFKPITRLVALIAVIMRKLNYSDFANSVRIEMYKIMGVTIGENVVIRPRVLIKGCANVEIGDGVFIGEGSSIVGYGGGVKIGANVLIADSVYISARNHRFRDKSKLVRDQGYKGKPVMIGDDVWLAHGVVVLAGSLINKGTIVGAHRIAPAISEPYSIHTVSDDVFYRK